MPPVQQGRELDSLDSVGDSEAKEQPVEVRLDGAPRHFQLAGNLRVITTLQQKISDLLLPRAQANGILPHCGYLEGPIYVEVAVGSLRPPPHTHVRLARGKDQGVGCTKASSIQDAMLKHVPNYSVDNSTTREKRSTEIATQPTCL